MNNVDFLAKTNEQLQDKNDELQSLIDEERTRIHELEAEITKLPSESEVANLNSEKTKLQTRVDELEAEVDTLNSEKTELQAQLDSDEMAHLKKMAAQGEASLEIAREDAKTAFKTRLMADGVKRTEVNEHPEYLAHCRQLDKMTALEEIQDLAEADYRSVRQSRRAGRASKELNEYASESNDNKVIFSHGANDLR